jgi:hypothetical protein
MHVSAGWARGALLTLVLLATAPAFFANPAAGGLGLQAQQRRAPPPKTAGRGSSASSPNRTARGEAIAVALLPTRARQLRRASGGQEFLGFNLNGLRGRVDSPGITSTAAGLLGGGGFLRYPGGSPANYWDWRSGWCVANSSTILHYPSYCSQPGLNYSLSEFSTLLVRMCTRSPTSSHAAPTLKQT